MNAKTKRRQEFAKRLKAFEDARPRPAATTRVIDAKSGPRVIDAAQPRVIDYAAKATAGRRTEVRG